MVFDIVVQEFILQVVLALIALFVPPAIIMAITLIRQQARLLRSRLSAEQIILLERLAGVAVKSWEQAGMAGYISNVGSVKRQKAIEWMDAVTKRMGLTEFREEDFIAAIEAAIRDGVHKADNPPPASGSN